MDLRRGLKNSLVAGLVLVAPLAVTAFVIVTLFGWLAGLLDPVVSGIGLADVTGDRLLARLVAAALLVAFVVALGFVAELSVGQRAFGGFDRLVGVLPLVSVVYSSVRQVADALVAGDSRYDRVVFVEYPRRDLYSVGFLTAAGPAELDDIAGEETVNVFLPNSPNPTAGRLVMVPAAAVHETDMSVRRAIRLVVTTGMAESPQELDAFRRDELTADAEVSLPAGVGDSADDDGDANA